MDNKTYEEDFKMIRSAIDGAKNPMNQLGGFFKSYAIINMITVVLYLIVSLYQGFVREMYIGRMICFVYLAYYIFRMYKEEKSNTNHYYQAMLYIYGSVVVVIPVILWIAGIIGSFTLNNEASQAGKMLEMLMNLQVFSAIILLSVSFLIVSFVRDNKIYAVCAIGNLVVYLIAFAIGIINWKYRDTLSRFVLLCYAYYWLYDISKMYKKRMIINERGYVTG